MIWLVKSMSIRLICTQKFLWPFCYSRNISRSTAWPDEFQTELLSSWMSTPSPTPTISLFFSGVTSPLYLMSAYWARQFVSTSKGVHTRRGIWLLCHSWRWLYHLDPDFWSKVVPYRKAFNFPSHHTLLSWRQFCTCCNPRISHQRQAL